MKKISVKKAIFILFLVAIFGEPESYAVFYMGKQDMSRLDLVNYVSHNIHKDESLLSDFTLNFVPSTSISPSSVLTIKGESPFLTS